MNDNDLRAIEARCGELLAQHEQERKETAIAKAAAALAEVGLDFKSVAARPHKNGNKGPVYHAGNRYQHPVEKTLVWAGKGKKPGWLVQLESEGRKPTELEPANDNFPPSLRKIG